MSGASSPVDVIVVGAGPSGLVAALRLMDLGLTVLIVDAATAPAQESRAALMHAATIEILAEMGMIEELLERGVRTRAVTLADGGRRLARVPFDELDSPYPFALGIPQNETEAILSSRLEQRGQRVIRGVHVHTIGLIGEAYRVKGTRVHSDEPWEASAAYVVGADGKNSTVREHAGIPYDGASYDEDFILADVELAPSPMPADEARITLSPHGVTVIGLLPSGRHRIVATAPRGRETPREPDRAYLDDLLRTRGITTNTRDAPAWSARFRISHQIARRFRAGNILLCGDAAHVHSPAAGQGMNTGIADAFELARRIAEARAGDTDALDEYERVRTHAAEAVVALTDRITRIALVRTRPARLFRNTAIRLLTRQPGIRRALVRSISGIDRSPLPRPIPPMKDVR
ncbi:FAD-dependent oxidoreductase [Leifsonia poae]|uniref:FAD-dependent oxidoreductase n=1 Tax=Leifsonia poae TaxID=110933 RepID=UPI001CBEC3AC|nr:NAD(P)/FAD-dependent oxidoreductase [Leifsonia poae]